MSNLIVRDLSIDVNLDKDALSRILGGNATAIAGSANSLAIASLVPTFPTTKCYNPCGYHSGPKAFQLSYNTSFEQAAYVNKQTSLNLSYFQA